jgi:hypothetical protein
MILYKTYLSAGAAFLLIIAALKQINRRTEFFQKHAILIDAFLYTACLFLVGFYFYIVHIWMGTVMAALCGIAIWKFLYDKSRPEKE